MTTFKDEEYSRDITVCNFSIERHGSGLDTKYVCSPKPPRAMDANMKAAIPPLEKFQAILEEIFPVKILERPAIAVGGAVVLDLPTSTVPEVPEEAFTF